MAFRQCRQSDSKGEGAVSHNRRWGPTGWLHISSGGLGSHRQAYQALLFRYRCSEVLVQNWLEKRKHAGVPAGFFPKVPFENAYYTGAVGTPSASDAFTDAIRHDFFRRSEVRFEFRSILGHVDPEIFGSFRTVACANRPNLIAASNSGQCELHDEVEIIANIIHVAVPQLPQAEINRPIEQKAIAFAIQLKVPIQRTLEVLVEKEQPIFVHEVKLLVNAIPQAIEALEVAMNAHGSDQRNQLISRCSLGKVEAIL